MTSTIEIGKEGSVEQPDNHHDQRAHETCPDCEGRVIATDVERFCSECGLVVGRDEIERTVSPSAHGPTRRNGPQEWAVEPTTAFRHDNGLGTRMDLGTDGYGNPLSTDKRKRLGRMRKFHRRLDKRDARLNEALRDVQTIGGNAGLPRWVSAEACRLVRKAADARLPGGRMAWEALAAGAVLLAARSAGVGREPETVATYAKAPHERVCAAARKIRVDCGLVEAVPPARSGAVDAVLANLDGQLTAEALLRYARLGRYLLGIADAAAIGPGTSRVTVAAAAVYAADRLTDGKALTQAGVVAAADPVVATSRNRIKRYNCALVDAYRARHGTDDPGNVLDRGSATPR